MKKILTVLIILFLSITNVSASSNTSKYILYTFDKDIVNNQVKRVGGLTFEVYDSNNKLIGTYTSNSIGIIELNLENGKYFIKQVSGLANHYYVNNFYIEIDNKISNQYSYLYSIEMNSKVFINNIDSNNNLINDSKFEIVKDNTNIKYIVSGNESIILNSGDYTVRELSVSDDYLINNNIYTFTIGGNSVEAKYYKLSNIDVNIMNLLISDSNLESDTCSKIEVKPISYNESSFLEEVNIDVPNTLDNSFSYFNLLFLLIPFIIKYEKY